MFPEPAKAADDHNMGAIVDTDTILNVFNGEDYVLISLYMNEFLWGERRELPVEQLTGTPSQVVGRGKTYILVVQLPISLGTLPKLKAS